MEDRERTEPENITPVNDNRLPAASQGIAAGVQAGGNRRTTRMPTLHPGSASTRRFSALPA